MLSDRQRRELCSKKRILVLQSCRLSKTSHQLVKPQKYISPASKMDAQKLTSFMENYKSTWMQESAFFARREEPLMTQLRKNGLRPAQMSQVVTYAKKQDQVPKLLLNIQFVRSPTDLKRARRAIRLTENVKTYLKRILLDDEETEKKASAADVCSNIRAQRDGSGRKIFTKEEWLVA